ncbi:MAG TPA: SOS response-associated peptidase family protein [Geminicoccaceae bacterium]
MSFLDNLQGSGKARVYKSKEPLETFTIVTTAANELMRPIHDRMPLILSPAHFDEWLASGGPPTRPWLISGPPRKPL